VRNALCSALTAFANDPDFIFLTGDLGFNALEPLRDAMGARFINAGVAEQNMVSVAAGLAMSGLRPWVYSIAPFIYGRPFEQIRNDVCLHDLPVILAGNGGGYAYGVMGSTHHALEDYGVLLTLPNMRAFVPAFADDVSVLVGRARETKHPVYLRLGKCERPKGFPLPSYEPWRRLITGAGPTMVVVGPLVGNILAALQNVNEEQRPALWVVTELPLNREEIPSEFFRDLQRSGSLVVVEEHVAHGGVGAMLAPLLLGQVALRHYIHHHARGYVSGLYGSQQFHRRESGLDPESILVGLQRL
jgi:transketolase